MTFEKLLQRSVGRFGDLSAGDSRGGGTSEGTLLGLKGGGQF